jgi:AmmeMemoRadiSam system protein B
MIIREPIVAGQSYPAEGQACRDEAVRLLRAVESPGDVSAPVYGGIVPHSAWSLSGPVTAKVFRALADRGAPDLVVFFGGAARYRGRLAAMFTSGRWETPIGPVDIDGRFAERLLSQTNRIIADNFAHEDETTIEVHLPFIRQVFPRARLVPIMVPVMSTAFEAGEAVARTIAAYKYDAMILGATNLTRYGPEHEFVPKGLGAGSLLWAKEVNDRRFLDLVGRLRENEVVPEAMQHHNADNSGAVAATIAAVAALGAERGMLLSHTTSAEVVGQGKTTDIENSIGYAGIVFTG